MRLLDEVRNLMGNYHVKSGIYHFYRSEFKQAVEFFKKALKDDASLSESDRRMARHYLTQSFVESAEKLVKKGDLEAAARDFGRAVEVSPDFPDIRFRHGRTLEALDRLGEAIDEYRLAVESNEDYEAARTALAFCLLRAGRDDEAAEAFGQVLALRIRQMRDPHEKGLARLREGMSSEAEEFFRDAFLTDSHRFQEHYREALALLKSEQYEKSLDELDRAIELNPKFGDLHNYRGIALCSLGRLDDAIAAFRRSIGLNPDYGVAQLNLAFAMLRAGLFKEAETQLEAVLERDPSQSAAALKLEELRTGRTTDARRGAGSRGASR
jgi:tetratricopeptide (TPR) repeat protein